MKKKIFYNIGSSLILEIVSVICSFILPRMIISEFGSEYNGIVSSVTQFLSVITLLRGGVGGVTRAALYKPLMDNDTNQISAILNSTEHFMRKISYIFVVFLVVFASGYPFLVQQEFDWFFSFSLVLILGISTFAQYYFGITYQFLLTADQKSYVYSILQTIATILNTIFTVILINARVDFRLVKGISSLFFAAIPIALYWYVHRHYTIVKTIPRNDSYIEQRWDAFAHQLATFVHSNTDLMLLTAFSDLYQVSVYAVYHMIVNGVKKFVTVFSSGLEATIGKLLATKDYKKLEIGFDCYEMAMNVISTVMFTSTALLMIPFIQVYTVDITDTNYIQPLFGYLLCVGFFLACVRIPYQNVVEAAGHFKKTRNGAIVEAIINIAVSLVLVIPFGCVGVAIGTVAAMLFRTIQYALYSSKNILNRSFSHLVKRMLVTCCNIAIIVIPYFLFGVDRVLCANANDYISWIVEALCVFGSVLLITIALNIVTYRKICIRLMKGVLKRK